MRVLPTRRRLLIVLVLLLPHLAGAEPAAAMKLWNKAVAITTRSAHYLPESVYSEVTVTDAQGNLKSSQRTWSRLSVGAGGSVKTTVVRSIRDGRDNTKKAQAELDRNPSRGRFDSAELPMMRSNQDRLEVTPTGRTRVIAGVPCTEFAFRMKGDHDRTTVGSVWLDEKNGAPLLLDFTFDPLPSGATVIRNTLHFAPSAGGVWHLVSLDTYAEGRLLFFSRVFRLHMEFSHYFRRTPPAKASGASQ